MLLLIRLIAVAVTGLFAWNPHAQIQCPGSPTSPTIILIENSDELASFEGKSIHYLDWSEDMQKNWPGKSNTMASDSFIYTSTVMNFLELASLVAWYDTSVETSQNMMATRIGLFFVQLNQSKTLTGIWNQLIKEHVPISEQQNFLGLIATRLILEKYPDYEQRKTFVEQLAKMIVLSGQQLHKISEYKPNIPFYLITSVAMNPRSQNNLWQELLYRLVEWQFSMSIEHLEKNYCKATSSNAVHLVIKIPPTPLLDFYINEFKLWGRRAGIPIDLGL